MKNPDQLKLYWERLGIKTAAIVGLLTIAWLSTFGEVHAQDDLCKSALVCTDEVDLVHVQNLSGVPLDSSKLGQAGLDTTASEAVSQSLGVLGQQGGGMYYSWDSNHEYIMVGGQLIPPEIFFGYLDVAAGYQAVPDLVVGAEVEVTPVVVVTPEKKNALEDGVSDEEYWNFWELFSKCFVLPSLGLFGLAFSGFVIEKIQSILTRKEVSKAVPGSLGSLLLKYSNDDGYIPTFQGVVMDEESENTSDVQSKSIKRKKLLPGQSLRLLPQNYIEKIPYNMPGNVLVSRQASEYNSVPNEYFRTMHKRRPLVGEKLGDRNRSFTVSGSCMEPIIHNNQSFTLCENDYLVIPKKRAGLVGDLVLVTYREWGSDTLSHTIGIYAGLHRGRLMLISTNDTTGKEIGGHGQITRLAYQLDRVHETLVIGSIAKNSEKAKLLVEQMIAEIKGRGSYKEGEER